MALGVYQSLDGGSSYTDGCGGADAGVATAETPYKLDGAVVEL